MTILFDGQNAFFAERGKTHAKSLVIHVPRNGALFFNGVCYFPESGRVHVPPEVLRRGENRLSLRMGNRIFPTEGSLYDGEGFSPLGLKAEPLLLRQNERISSLEKDLALLEERVARLEEKSTARMLFS